MCIPFVNSCYYYYNVMLLFVCHLRVSVFFYVCVVVHVVILNIHVTCAYLCFYYVNTNVVVFYLFYLLYANTFCLPESIEK